VEVTNTDCYDPPDLCDPDLPENATILDIDPGNDALGISMAAFAPNGTRRYAVEDDVIYLSTGAYSQVSVSYERTWHYPPSDTPEENYTMTTSSIRFVPNAYAVNFVQGQSFQMDDVVYCEIGFGELSFREVNESLAYEAFNAFGDATAIVGFFTGFGLFGGPTFLGLIMDNADRGFWSRLFYK